MRNVWRLVLGCGTAVVITCRRSIVAEAVSAFALRWSVSVSLYSVRSRCSSSFHSSPCADHARRS